MMNDVVELVSVELDRDPDGYPMVEKKKKEVFCEVQSVKRSEFYEAYKAGLELALTVLMWNCDYSGEKDIEYSGKHYKVERTYMKDRQTIELNCSEVIR